MSNKTLERATPTEIALASAITELRTLRMLKTQILQSDAGPVGDVTARVIHARCNVVSAIANAITSASEAELQRLHLRELSRISAVVAIGITGPEDDQKIEGELERALSGKTRPTSTEGIVRPRPLSTAPATPPPPARRFEEPTG